MLCFKFHVFTVQSEVGFSDSVLYLCVSQVFKLLTDLKEQRKESGKNKHSAGQQNLNTIMYEVSLHPFPSLHRLLICTFTKVRPWFIFVFPHRR